MIILYNKKDYIQMILLPKFSLKTMKKNNMIKSTKKKETMKKKINKARKLINKNPKNNHNLTNDDIKDFLNSFDDFNQAFNFINAHNKLCKSSFFFHA